MRTNLIVLEDDADWREHFVRELQSFGMVDAASTLDSAVALSGRKYYEFAVVDLRLRTDDTRNAEGLDYLKFLHALGEGTSTVIISATATVGIARDAFTKYGAHQLLEKMEVANSDLRSIVESGVAKAQAKLGSPDMIAFFRGDQSEPVFVDRLLRTLQPHGGYTGLRNLLAHVGSEMWPLTHSGDSPGLRVESQPLGAGGRFWSRRLGSAVAVRLRPSAGAPPSKPDLGRLLSRVDAHGVSGEVIELDEDVSRYRSPRAIPE